MVEGQSRCLCYMLSIAEVNVQWAQRIPNHYHQEQVPMRDAILVNDLEVMDATNNYIMLYILEALLIGHTNIGYNANGLTHGTITHLAQE